jgi:hypothetical protein
MLAMIMNAVIFIALMIDDIRATKRDLERQFGPITE